MKKKRIFIDFRKSIIESQHVPILNYKYNFECSIFTSNTHTHTERSTHVTATNIETARNGSRLMSVFLPSSLFPFQHLLCRSLWCWSPHILHNNFHQSFMYYLLTSFIYERICLFDNICSFSIIHYRQRIVFLCLSFRRFV